MSVVDGDEADAVALSSQDDDADKEELVDGLVLFSPSTSTASIQQTHHKKDHINKRMMSTCQTTRLIIHSFIVVRLASRRPFRILR